MILEVPSQVKTQDIEEQYITDGWIHAQKYVPDRYELVLLKKELTDKPIKGWWTPNGFDGYRVNSMDIYKYWKKID